MPADTYPLSLHDALPISEALALARDRGGDEVQGVDLGVGVRQRGAGLTALVDDHVHVGGVLGVDAAALAPHLDGGLHLDRKSTRLNSSHMSISYAVFCLK